MNVQELHAARKGAAEEAGELADREIEKGRGAASLEFGRTAAAEIGLDHRPPERAQVIGGGAAAIGAAEQAALLLELFGMGEREKQLVGEAERQAGGGLRLRRQRGRES